MTRIIFLCYGLVCYLAFLASFTYAVGFVTGLVVPVTLDGEPTVPQYKAILIDMAVLAVFALQHSIMARRGFKKWWTTIIPAPLERSTFTLVSSICLSAIIYFWQPIGGTIWKVENSTVALVLTVLSLLGFGLVVLSTFFINHFDLFGLRQVWFYFNRKHYAPVKFVQPVVYKYVRHPLYLGFVIAFWSTPVMTLAHFLFALLCTGYILVGIYLEERDLVKEHGDSYLEYRKRVPKLLPFTKSGK